MSVIYNKDKVIFSSALYNSVLYQPVPWQEFLTPFGLYLPLVERKSLTLRFLRDHCNPKKPDVKLLGNYIWGEGGVLFTRDNTVDFIMSGVVEVDKEKGKVNGSLVFTSLWKSPPTWCVLNESAEIGVALTTICSQWKDEKRLLKFIEANAPEKLMSPVVLRREEIIRELASRYPVAPSSLQSMEAYF